MQVPVGGYVLSAGVMSDFDVLGTVTLAAPTALADAVLHDIDAIHDSAAGYMAAASRLPNDAGLVYKVLAREIDPVKAKVREFCQLVRRQACGALPI